MNDLTDAGIICKACQLSVAATTDKLLTQIEEKGFKVFANIDHQAGAKSVELALAPARTIIFGNPVGGTPLMQSSLTAALDLPLKIAVYEQANGSVELAYNDPAWLTERHAITNCEALTTKLSGALNLITNYAAG